MEKVGVETQLLFGTSCLKNHVPQIEHPILVFPGMAYVDKQQLKIDDKLLSKHLLLLGGSGCGKSTTFLHAIEQLRKQMSSNSIAIVFDTKGEYCEHFFLPGDIIIGNGKKYRSISHTPNLFSEILADGLDDESIVINSKEIAASLFVDRGSTTQPFFSNAARDIFCCILVHFIRSAKRDPSIWGNRLNNKDLSLALRGYSETDIKRILEFYPDTHSYVSYIGDGTSNQALGVMAELNSMVSDYFVGVFADHVPTRSTCMRSLVRQKKGRIVFLEYDLSVGETLSPIYRLLVDQALKEALSRKSIDAEEKDGRVFLIADEFRLLPKLQHIDDALNFGRGMGVRVMAGIQSIDQLYDAYGQYKGAVLAGGFANLFAFHTNDDSSRKYITGRFGKNMIAYQFFNKLQGKDDGTIREGNTVECWEQMDLEVGQAIIGLCNQPPFVYQFFDYQQG